MFLEVCAFNIQSAIVAQRVGAVRAELCDNPIEGGTTPSYGAIYQTRKSISIQLYPIIRPRAGSYFYDDDEFEMMLKDIEMCKQLGCDGISVGVQRKDGTIDADRLKKIVSVAYPMGVTCNRAFDAVPDPYAALETIIDAGCERILTSGLKSAAPGAIREIKDLVEKAAGRIVIMPGAGINSGNIEQMIRETGATEFHTSARMAVQSKMEFINPQMHEDLQYMVADKKEIEACLSVLHKMA